MKILGIDPGYERLGIAVLDPVAREQRSEKKHDHKVVYSECFKTSAKLKFEERLLLLGQKVKKIIQEYKPEVLAIETLFMTTNQKTVMYVSEARGVIMYEAISAGLKIFEATPLQVKIATTGYGRADKKDVLKMVRMLVDIDKDKKSDDELDAIAIALTGFAHLKNSFPQI